MPVVTRGKLTVDKLTDEDDDVMVDELGGKSEAVWLDKTVVDVPLTSVVIVLTGLGFTLWKRERGMQVQVSGEVFRLPPSAASPALPHLLNEKLIGLRVAVVAEDEDDDEVLLDDPAEDDGLDDDGDEVDDTD